MVQAETLFQRRPVVLLIEDDRDTREMYKTYLLAQGLNVVAARNGMEGFTRACETGPDVIVTTSCCPTSTAGSLSSA
jgi:CheY-like chemotaxis protein